MSPFGPRIEQWFVLENEYNGDRYFVISDSGHERSKDGNTVWLYGDGNVAYDGPDYPPPLGRVVKEGWTEF